MKNFNFILFILSIFFLNNINIAKSQTLISNTCDSIVLNQEEFQKCKNDELWNKDIVEKSNFIIFLQTQLFPKYRSIRKSLLIPETILNDIHLLRFKYDSTLYHKTTIMKSEMYKNQNFVQPNAYISSVLSLEFFKFYPDVHAILLNDVHLVLNPKTTFQEIENSESLVQSIYSKLDKSLIEILVKTTSRFADEKKTYINGKYIEFLKGNVSEEITERNNIINFLLWDN